jgi:hypothetical protein
VPIYDGKYNKIIGKAVAQFSLYSEEIESMLVNQTEHTIDNTTAAAFLNGKANESLRSLVPMTLRRDAGIFFTGKVLAENVASYVKPILEKGGVVIDPALGAGNLLLTCSEYLPPQPSLEDTLKTWSKLLKGYDLYPEMAKATRLRLFLSAAIRHPEEINRLGELMLDDYFKGIRSGDAFTSAELSNCSCVVVNPPFGYMKAHKNCQWGTGQVQIAAWFMEKIFQITTPGQHIVAILPDVLRSGSRHGRWRDLVAHHCTSLTLESAGRFDKEVDIDVFILHAIIRSDDDSSCKWPQVTHGNNPQNTETISDYFNVHVGPIVPHRDLKEGLFYPYLHARNAKHGQIIKRISEKVQTKKRLFTPPFVVVHRTSSPNDNPRCVTSIVNGRRKVALENHLIVLLPKNGTLKSCEELANKLIDKRTNIWLNEVIRCRHLTVPSLKSIPWWR